MTIPYDEKIVNQICDEMAAGDSLLQVVKKHKDEPNFPSYATLLRWAEKYPDFAIKCARAREFQSEHNFDKHQEIMDKLENRQIDADTARVLLSGLQWRIPKLAPKKYGEKQSVDVKGSLNIESLIQQSYKKESDKEGNQ